MIIKGIALILGCIFAWQTISAFLWAAMLLTIGDVTVVVFKWLFG